MPCNVCGSSRSRLLYHRPYRAEGAAADFAATTDEFNAYGRVVRCLDCGFAYTNPRPNAAALVSGYVHCADEDYALESSSRSINAHFSLSTIKRFVKKGKLLEIGSAAGYFLNAARADFEVVGLEPSQFACREARERFRLDCHPETLEQSTRFAPGSFDVVAMIDVIEHLSDPASAVRRAAELLRPGGLLYLVTPDISSLSAKLLRSYWWGLRPAHIYYFDEGTLKTLLEKAGLETKLVKSFGRIFTLGYWASRLRNYPRPIHGLVSWAIERLDVADKFTYLDTRDSIELCAVKRP